MWLIVIFLKPVSAADLQAKLLVTVMTCRSEWQAYWCRNRRCVNHRYGYYVVAFFYPLFCFFFVSQRTGLLVLYLSYTQQTTHGWLERIQKIRSKQIKMYKSQCSSELFSHMLSLALFSTPQYHMFLHPLTFQAELHAQTNIWIVYSAWSFHCHVEIQSRFDPWV